MKILVITGGTLNETFLKKFLKNHFFDQTIVVDGALKMVEKLGIPFQSLVGDFDTIDSLILEPYLKKTGLYIEKHKPQKDETDTELAVDLGIKKIKESGSQNGQNEIAILGATGGRLYHLLGNIHLVYRALQEKIVCKLYDEDNCLFMVKGKETLGNEANEYRYVSFLPFTDVATGVTLEGFQYPLQDARLEKGCTLGISNEICGSSSSVTVEQGILIGIFSRDHREE